MFRFTQRWPLLPGLLMVGLFLYMTGTGFGGTPDSVHYLWAARSFRDTGQLVSPDGSAYRFWGPLYPLLLSVFFGNNWVRVLHGTALVVQLLLWSKIAKWFIPSKWASLLPWLLALSAAVLTPAKFIWSEVVFGAIAAAYFYGLLAWLRKDQINYLLLATAAGFLLPLQRTSGFFLLAGAGAGMLLTGAWRGRRWALAGHWLCCAVGGLAWNYYAEVVAGPPVYQALRGWGALGNSVADYGFVLVRWLVPLSISWRELLPGLWAASLLGMLWLLWPQRHAEKAAIGACTQPSPDSADGLRLLWWTLVVTIVALLVATNATRAAAGTHDAERYIAVLAGPVLLLALASWQRAASSIPFKNPKWRGAGNILLAALLIYSAARVARNAHGQRQRTAVVWPLGAPAQKAGYIEKGKAADAAFPQTLEAKKNH